MQLAIHEHNRQIFDSLKQQAARVFDVLLTKSQSVWKAIGNSLKTALLTAIKEVVTSRVAATLMYMFTGQKVSFAGVVRGLAVAADAGRAAARWGSARCRYRRDDRRLDSSARPVTPPGGMAAVGGGGMTQQQAAQIILGTAAGGGGAAAGWWRRHVEGWRRRPRQPQAEHLRLGKTCSTNLGNLGFKPERWSMDEAAT